MPTRSMTLRLDLSDASHRNALWTTHRLVNEKARWFMERLLLLRGDEVWTADADLARFLGHSGREKNAHNLFEVKAAHVQMRLREHVRKLKPDASIQDLEQGTLGLMALYDLIVPTHGEAEDQEEGSGDSGTLAKKWLKPLVDRTSDAFETEQAKAIAPPWVEQKARGEAWEAEASAWLQGVFKVFEEKRYAEAGITAGYSKSGWYKAAKSGASLEAWVQIFEKDVAKFQKSPIGPVVSRLRNLGILDCARDYQGFKQILGTPDSLEMTKWDYLVLTRVITRLLSWESWNHRARKEHAKRKAAVEEAKRGLAPFPAHLDRLRAFEAARTADLIATNQLSRDMNARGQGDTDFRLGGRQVRKWEELARDWKQARARNANANLHDVAADFQANNPRECPDPYFTEWVLEDPSRSPLWDTDEGVRTVSLLAKLNRLQARLDKSRERTAMTPPHARLHPAWLQFEEPSGSNLKNMDLVQLPEGGLAAQCDLIQEDPEDHYQEIKDVRIPIRPSAQLALQRLDKCNKKDGGPGKTPVLTFVQAPDLRRIEARRDFETWTGKMQSPDILLDRDYMNKVPGQGPSYLAEHPDTPLDPAHLKADLKLVLDLDVKAVPGACEITPFSKDPQTKWKLVPQWARLLNCSLAIEGDTEKKHLPRYLAAFETLAAGQRFLAVDLGVRDLAAVAFFKLQKGHPLSGEKAFPIPASAPWKAVYVEGSLTTLSLDGELNVLKNGVEAKRREAEGTLRLLRFLKTRRTRLLALASEDVKDSTRQKALDWLQVQPKDEAAVARAKEETDRRQKALDALWRTDEPPQAKRDRPCGAKRETHASNVDACNMDALRQAAGLAPLPGNLAAIDVAQTTLEQWDRAIADLIHVWRDRTRRRDREHAGLHGKSLWAVEHLTEVRDFLKGWHRRGMMSGEINRPGADFAKALLEHINQLKEDRTKEGANLLVNAARGLRYDATTHCWEEKYPPAHLILFEDLSRYRFFTDRPRHENSQLMRWSHRELTKVVAEMAQLFGIGTMDTGAAFSSRYHGWTGAPGVRCRVFTQEELNAPWFQRKWKKAGFGWNPVPGQPVPWDGGKLFCTLDDDGKLIQVDADHNAAVSLARRFALRSGETFRLVCIQKGDNFVPTSLGKRLLGGLKDPTNPKDKGYGWLCPSGKEAFHWEPLTQAEWEKRSGAKKADDEDLASATLEDDDALAEAQEAADAESESIEGAKSGKKIVFFRDPSGVFFPPSTWVPGKAFWDDGVKQKIANALKAFHEAQRPF